MTPVLGTLDNVQNLDNVKGLIDASSYMRTPDGRRRLSEALTPLLDLDTLLNKSAGGPIFVPTTSILSWVAHERRFKKLKETTAHYTELECIDVTPIIWGPLVLYMVSSRIEEVELYRQLLHHQRGALWCKVQASSAYIIHGKYVIDQNNFLWKEVFDSLQDPRQEEFRQITQVKEETAQTIIDLGLATKRDWTAGKGWETKKEPAPRDH
jgi:hypothetical protein